MQVQIDSGWAMALFCVVMRIGTLLLLSPVFSGFAGMASVRVLFTLALSIVLMAGLDLPFAAPANDMTGLALAALGEVAIGALLAFGVFAAFGAFAVAGKILDVQSGFGLGSVYDPITRAGAPLFASLLNLAALAVFFAVGAHHALLRGIAFSLRQMPPGGGLGAVPIDAVIRQFGLMFSLGVAVIVPVLFCLLLAEVALAAVSRVLPQMNIFIVGVPVKIVAALAVLAVSLGSSGAVIERIHGSIFRYWEQVLR